MFHPQNERNKSSNKLYNNNQTKFQNNMKKLRAREGRGDLMFKIGAFVLVVGVLVGIWFLAKNV